MKISSQRLRQIEEIFMKASALAPDQRKSFLAEACAEDEPLLRELESLLSHENAAKTFLEIPALLERMHTFTESWQEISETGLTDRTLGRYRILDRIGAGGMGEVYRAQDTRLERTVALKVLPPHMMADPERIKRFVREAKAASALNHPNIITIYDIDRADGIDFIAMEYIVGRTLQELIAGGPLGVPDAVNYAQQIVQALEAAHAAGIIHRDIKPANIMIAQSPSGAAQVKVLDFGLAKLSESSFEDRTMTEVSVEGSILGTAAYMSPEQAEGKPVDSRSDIFSFGSVFHEMLSGRRAFHGNSNIAILTSVLRETPEPVPGIPAAIQAIISQCLEKDITRRISSAAELGTALKACLPLTAGAEASPKTIAVLPFTNLSGDRDKEYFSDGLTEELISALTGISGLRVTARTSAFALRDRNLDIREIGARLNVEHILEGSVRISGNRVRVTAQVINAADGYQLWSERYDREMRDVLDIQDEIAHAIADTLRVRLAKDISLVRKHTSSPEAYSLYLRGRFHLEKHTPEGYSRARNCFLQAISADPQYALALLGLAEFYWQNAFYGFMYPREALTTAKEKAIRALEINDAVAESHSLLGTMLGLVDCDWKAAGSAFKRALELDANSHHVLFRYANYFLWPRGHSEEAIAIIERTLTVDPLWVLDNWVLAYFIYALKQYDRAIEHLYAVIDLDPTFHLAYAVLGLAYSQKEKHGKEIEALEKAREFSSGNPFFTGMLAYGLGKAGKTEDAAGLIEQLVNTGRHTYVSAKSLMFAWAGLNDPDKVLEYAEKSLDDRDPMTIMNLGREPALDFVRSDPRFPDLLRKINLK